MGGKRQGRGKGKGGQGGGGEDLALVLVELEEDLVLERLERGLGGRDELPELLVLDGDGGGDEGNVQDVVQATATEHGRHGRVGGCCYGLRGALCCFHQGDKERNEGQRLEEGKGRREV